MLILQLLQYGPWCCCPKCVAFVIDSYVANDRTEASISCYRIVPRRVGYRCCRRWCCNGTLLSFLMQMLVLPFLQLLHWLHSAAAALWCRCCCWNCSHSCYLMSLLSLQMLQVIGTHAAIRLATDIAAVAVLTAAALRATGIDHATLCCRRPWFKWNAVPEADIAVAVRYCSHLWCRCCWCAYFECTHELHTVLYTYVQTLQLQLLLRLVRYATIVMMQILPINANAAGESSPNAVVKLNADAAAVPTTRVADLVGAGSFSLDPYPDPDPIGT